MYMANRPRSFVDFLTWLGCKRGVMGFLVSLCPLEGLSCLLPVS